MKVRKLIGFVGLLFSLGNFACGCFVWNYTNHERWRELEGGGAGEVFAPNYDPKTVITVTGEVAKVETFVAKLMKVKAVRIVLNSQSRSYEAHLGPLWYIERQAIVVKPGDVITVTGSLVNDKIMIQQFEKEGQIFLLRSKEGQPKWFKAVSRGASQDPPSP